MIKRVARYKKIGKVITIFHVSEIDINFQIGSKVMKHWFFHVQNNHIKTQKENFILINRNIKFITANYIN